MSRVGGVWLRPLTRMTLNDLTSMECFSRGLWIACLLLRPNLWSFFLLQDDFVRARLPATFNSLCWSRFMSPQSIKVWEAWASLQTKRSVHIGRRREECLIKKVDFFASSCTLRVTGKAFVFMVLQVVQLHYMQQWHLSHKMPKVQKDDFPTVWLWPNAVSFSWCFHPELFYGRQTLALKEPLTMAVHIQLKDVWSILFKVCCAFLFQSVSVGQVQRMLFKQCRSLTLTM